jgi:hypothetical protein
MPYSTGISSERVFFIKQNDIKKYFLLKGNREELDIRDAGVLLPVPRHHHAAGQTFPCSTPLRYSIKYRKTLHIPFSCLFLAHTVSILQVYR